MRNLFHGIFEGIITYSSWLKDCGSVDLWLIHGDKLRIRAIGYAFPLLEAVESQMFNVLTLIFHTTESEESTGNVTD